MDLLQLKCDIEAKNINTSLLIFNCTEHYFLPMQYVHAIAKAKNLDIEYIDSLKQKLSKAKDVFGMKNMTPKLQVLKTDEFSNDNELLKTITNVIIITKKIDKSTRELFKDYIVDVPKLESWQIADYVYSNAEGVSSENLDWLLRICDNDIYRLDQELSKLSIFSEAERQYLFEDMKHQGAFSDLSSYNVFNITNAVLNKDIKALKNILAEIKSFDAEPLGVITILYQNFKKQIQVLFAKNATPESTGLKANVIYAIKKAPRVYSAEQILKCFLEMTDIDRKLKSGELFDMQYLIDYAICKVLTR